MPGIHAPAPAPAPKTALAPESKWMLERGGGEAEGIRGEAEAKQPCGAGVSEISAAVHGDPLADGITQPRFQVSSGQQGSSTFTQEKTSPDYQIPHRKAHADGIPLRAAEQLEVHVGNKVNRHDILNGEISRGTYVELTENEQIGVERSVAMEINSQANSILGSSAIDEIMEPQMADYFDFMGDYGLDQATCVSSEQAEHSPVQLQERITTVKELLASGLFQNEEIVYLFSKTKLRGKIDGVFYRCSCHNEAMPASKFEKHAGYTSHKANERIMLWGERWSLHGIVAYLKSLGSKEEQLAAIWKMKKKNENRKASRGLGG
ncbi:uncharacterized protein LOC123427416 isoform X2 [Hordeum vulgare subsp. vulgare]|uniref:uncharacterized protein LOC123427416 isoform X2 n=1 Tax=Hordeum vulgare subsp. vulgare TaxID=112509 RepID=UPI001D1A484E|nr:uncharacterized protein LOC123427416 isoform X2 [Hordeum vulgare subsp. vulgare]